MDDPILGVIITLLLVLANAFFVAAEFAIVKVRASQIELRAQSGERMAKIAQRLITHLDEYLSATQLGITLASLGLGWVGEPIVSKLLIAGLRLVGFGVDDGLAHKISRHPGAACGPNPGSMNTGLWNMDSGFAAEPVLGPREARTRGRRPGMTVYWAKPPRWGRALL